MPDVNGPYAWRHGDGDNDLLRKILNWFNALGAKAKSISVSSVEPDTELVAWSGTQLGGNSGQSFAPSLVGNRTQRKAILVDNQSDTLNLELRDEANVKVLEIRPESTVILPVSTFVRVENPNGMAVNCSVAEIYWVG